MAPSSAPPGPALRAVGHELVDHTSEITLRVWAPDFPALIAEATRAFAALVPAEIARTPSRELREAHLAAADRAARLVEWLNELVYLAEAELWLGLDATAEPESAGGLRVRVAGVGLSEPFVQVKAATLHGARVEETAEGLTAEVTLDV